MNIHANTQNGVPKLYIGQEVYDTSSTINFDNVSGHFNQDTELIGEVLVEKVWEDLSEYVEGKHNNGGCYAFYGYIIVDIIRNYNDIKGEEEAFSKLEEEAFALLGI